METKPYTLIIDGKLQGFYASSQSAVYAARAAAKKITGIDPYVLASPRNERNDPLIKIYYEGPNGQTLVHEE